VYAALKKENPDFRLEEEAVSAWSSDLIDEGHVSEAIELRKLNAAEDCLERSTALSETLSSIQP
jgi:hypothetical protein